MIILCITNFEMLMSKSLKNKSSFCFYCVFRKLSAVLHQYSSSQRKWWTKTLTLQCENSMKTNTSNRWLPFRGQHPFKIHMQLLKHPCRNIHTHTRKCTSHLYTPAASVIVLTCTSLIHFLFVSRSVWNVFEKCLSTAESYNLTLVADFTYFHCTAPSCPGCGFAC